MEGVHELVSMDPSLLLVAWFEETFQELQHNPDLSQHVIKASSLILQSVIRLHQ